MTLLCRARCPRSHIREGTVLWLGVFSMLAVAWKRDSSPKRQGVTRPCAKTAATRVAESTTLAWQAMPRCHKGDACQPNTLKIDGAQQLGKNNQYCITVPSAKGGVLVVVLIVLTVPEGQHPPGNCLGNVSVKSEEMDCTSAQQPKVINNGCKLRPMHYPLGYSWVSNDQYSKTHIGWVAPLLRGSRPR